MAQKAAAAATKSAPRSSKKNKNGSAAAPDKRHPVRRAIGGSLCLTLSIFAFLGYLSSDGIFIEWFNNLLRGLVGRGVIFVSLMLLISALILFFHRGKPVALRLLCALLLPSAAGSLYQLFTGTKYELSFKMFGSLWTDGLLMRGGGALSGSFSILFEKLFSKTGAAIIFLCFLAVMFAIIAWRPLRIILKKYNARPRYEPEPEPVPVPELVNKKENRPESNISQNRAHGIDIPIDEPRDAKEKPKRSSLFNKTPAVITPDEIITGKPPVIEAISREQEHKPSPDQSPVPIAPATETEAKKTGGDSFIPPKEQPRIDNYKFPPLTLLGADTTSGKTDWSAETNANRERLEAALASFGINSLVSEITRGPAVTRYEIELEAGVKLNRLTNLADDLALSLGASGVRIAPIPNKISTVGIEVPNKTISRVHLRDIIDTREFKNAESKLTFAIGKNISGDAICGNISKLPHMLVAGTTGSGKSVCMNSLILSILYKATPDEVRFILIDPKMVEFKIYNGIPHLLVPVVTEAKKASGALQWAVTEMMKRYRLFSESGARDILSYNELCAEAEEDSGMRQIPHIVIVIDELADLMLVAAKEVEESVCRVAQMGRAAGVHLIIATQSPRADVITGLMKANIPSRIALKVSSALESRIILDAGGAADKLVGNGDMLFAPIGTSKPTRIQGTWVSDAERENIVKFVKKSGEAEYAQDVIDQIEKAAEGKKSEKPEQEQKSDYDELLPQGVDVIFDTGQASVSMLQRRLKLGYARAARLVDQMEELGVVGPFEGSKPRQILLTRQQWQEMQFVQGTAPTESAPAVKPGEISEQTLFSADDLFKT